MHSWTPSTASRWLFSACLSWVGSLDQSADGKAASSWWEPAFTHLAPKESRFSSAVERETSKCCSLYLCNSNGCCMRPLGEFFWQQQKLFYDCRVCQEVIILFGPWSWRWRCYSLRQIWQFSESLFLRLALAVSIPHCRIAMVANDEWKWTATS